MELEAIFKHLRANKITGTNKALTRKVMSWLEQRNMSLDQVTEEDLAQMSLDLKPAEIEKVDPSVPANISNQPLASEDPPQTPIDGVHSEANAVLAEMQRQTDQMSDQMAAEMSGMYNSVVPLGIHKFATNIHELDQGGFYRDRGARFCTWLQQSFGNTNNSELTDSSAS